MITDSTNNSYLNTLNWASNGAIQCLNIVKNTLIDTTPSLLQLSPWHMSRMVNMRITVPAYATFDTLRLLFLGPNTTTAEKVNSAFIVTQSLVLGLNSFNLIPTSLPFRLAADSILLLGTLSGSSRAILEGSKLISEGTSSDDTTKKVSKYISGALLITLSGLALAYAYQNAASLMEGLEIYKGLDQQQQYGVLKYRALQHLPGEKECNAVIIDTIGSSFNELIYSKCHALYYKLTSSEDFCSSLKNAEEQFNSKIDVLSLNGHGFRDNIYIGPNFGINKSLPEHVSCMMDHIDEFGQIFVNSCHSAMGDNNIAKRISKLMTGREVIGYPSYFNSLLTINSFANGKFAIETFSPFASLALGKVFPFNSITYVDGTEVAG